MIMVYLSKIEKSSKTYLLENFFNKNTFGKSISVNFYEFLVEVVLNLCIKNNKLIIKPNYKLLNCEINLFFKHNNQTHNIIIDGTNNCLVVGGTTLKNIHSIGLKFLKSNEEVANML